MGSSSASTNAASVALAGALEGAPFRRHARRILRFGMLENGDGRSLTNGVVANYDSGAPCRLWERLVWKSLTTVRGRH